jgi:hypothetical protein
VFVFKWGSECWRGAQVTCLLFNSSRLLQLCMQLSWMLDVSYIHAVQYGKGVDR